jgi:DNA-binding response OmpR family regulator
MSVFLSVVSTSPGTTVSTPSPFATTHESRKDALVLLIEDDDLVADIVERLLSRSGKRVLRARDGAEGAQLFAEYRPEIALVMLDCGLPDIDGAALCRVLRQHAPTMPVILTSGWDNQNARALVDQGPTVFLPKPFFPSQVEELIAALLGEIA